MQFSSYNINKRMRQKRGASQVDYRYVIIIYKYIS